GEKAQGYHGGAVLELRRGVQGHDGAVDDRFFRTDGEADYLTVLAEGDLLETPVPGRFRPHQLPDEAEGEHGAAVFKIRSLGQGQDFFSPPGHGFPYGEDDRFPQPGLQAAYAPADVVNLSPEIGQLLLELAQGLGQVAVRVAFRDQRVLGGAGGGPGGPGRQHQMIGNKSNQQKQQGETAKRHDDAPLGLPGAVPADWWPLRKRA